MIGLEELIAKGAWWLLTIKVCELMPLALHVWPKLRVMQFVVSVHLLCAAYKLIAQAASVGQIPACICLLLHMVPGT